MNKNSFSWMTRIRLCWNVFTRGKYDSRDYKTIHEEKQWKICEKRREELTVSCRSREPFTYRDELDEQ